MTPEDIYEIYQAYHVPRKVVKHMVKVARFAEKLCNKFTKRGHKIDRDSVVKAALLHDIARIADFRELRLKTLKQPVTSKDLGTWIDLTEKYSAPGHEEAAAKILRKRGHNKIAKLIKKHDFSSVGELDTWEEKILYYADKRIEGTRKVSLKKRFRKGRKRNMRPGESIKRIEKIENKVYDLEKEIFNALASR
jgi:putative nucleotidyltransferase with HDIG domain